MKTITQEELDEKIKLHELYLCNVGGERLILSGYDLRGADLSYEYLSYADLSGVNLRGVNLSNVNLRGVNLRYADLRGADFRYANLPFVDFLGAKLSKAVGNGQEIKSAQFLKWSLTWTASDLAIGCEQHTIEDWFNFDDETIKEMDSGAFEFWKKNKDLIKLMIKGDV